MLSTEEDSQVILLAHLQLFLQLVITAPMLWYDIDISICRYLEEKSETLFTNHYISSEESKKN